MEGTEVAGRRSVLFAQPAGATSDDSAGDEDDGTEPAAVTEVTEQVMRRASSSGMSERGKRRTSLGLHGTITVPAKAGLSEQRVQELREVFSLFDTEGAGQIIPSDLLEAAKEVHLDESNPDIWRMLAGLRSEDDEPIDFEEFIRLVTEPLGDHFTRSGTSRLLSLIGPNAAILGSVGVADLQAMVDELGLEMEEDELEDLLKDAGSGADDRLTINALDKVMRSEEEEDEADSS
mmetsp:Transcript_36516/g.66932  ORF Transcript_36516/g.66932 Transcript_36516/m.66932 type:complete len:234 (+) Transcript_36516:108-809(+)